MHTVTTHGTEIPAIGLGTWRLRGADAERVVRFALTHGYRHLDTAQSYGNEDAVGAGLASSGVRRAEVFLTTKVRTGRFRDGDLQASVDESLQALGTDAVDLLLLHWPDDAVPLAEQLGALADVARSGRAAGVGVSNYPSALLRTAAATAEVPLLTNQVEYHPYLPQHAVLDAVRDLGSTLTAYAPLARGALADDPVLRDVAAAHGASVGQISLAWLVRQPQVVAIPKSGNEQRLVENLAAAEIELSADEVRRIDALARPDGAGRRVGGDAVRWDVD